MKGLTLTQREQSRLQVLNRLVEPQLTMREATAILGLSERHTWRMLAAYRKEGAAALAHGNRGRRPRNAVPEETRRKVIELARARYAGFNHTHLAEIIAEREGMVVSRSTVRSILLSAGLPSPRYRRPPRHRHRRQRMPQEGILLQLDGSYHAWLEDRGPWLKLLLAVDDATGTVPYGILREREDTQGYFELLEGIIARHGIPLGVYTRPPRRLPISRAEAWRGLWRSWRYSDPMGSCPAGARRDSGICSQPGGERTSGASQRHLSGSIGV